MQVVIPTQLRDYTRASQVEARGASVEEVLRDLDRRFPGIRFRIVDEQDRIRPHLRIFVDGAQAPTLKTRVRPDDLVLIFGALSGG
ncbi:MAG: MoaD/ThiS family protein [Gammaproteobacteria bacterium]|nr:MoaD/ThiS family protein [Gammaproteobacteria bacterium]